jgi:hypothetical protein
MVHQEIRTIPSTLTFLSFPFFKFLPQEAHGLFARARDVKLLAAVKLALDEDISTGASKFEASAGLSNEAAQEVRDGIDMNVNTPEQALLVISFALTKSPPTDAFSLSAEPSFGVAKSHPKITAGLGLLLPR